ncbi:hypothetical protein LIER_27724 [Lithospermum erythrorhizon]|uniref:Uncharacterized protein n=1 Tax=Lithospermum erythrorhizon TaxID=34254 RepID=A0AAV3RH61_LITER
MVTGLQIAQALKIHRLIVRGDSKLVIEQIKGDCGVKSEILMKYYAKALTLTKGFEFLQLEHIPRAQNEHADHLSRDVSFFETIFAYDSFKLPPLPNDCLPIVPVNDVLDEPSPLSNVQTIPTHHTIVEEPSTSSTSSSNSTSDPNNISVSLPATRQSARPRKPVVWLNDYVLASVSDCDSLPLFTPTQISFLAKLSHVQEPYSYKQASLIKDWINAMNVELQALEKNKTWDLVDLPKEKKPFGCKWIYRVKCRPDGSVHKFKARLVAKAKNWFLHQLDINNAFLHGYLDEDIYMLPPQGYDKAICNQAYGFLQSSHDHCLLTYETAGCFLVLLVYVDDILVVGDSEHEIEPVKQFLHHEFTIKDLGQAKYFLGIEIARFAFGLMCILWKIQYFMSIQSNTKHIEIDCHVIRDQYKAGFVLRSHVSTKHQLADIFTKSLFASMATPMFFKMCFIPSESS